MEPFATILSAEIQSRGWSHNEVARRAGVSQATVSRYCDGSREPSLEYAMAIARALSVSLDVLVGWKESPVGLTEDERVALKLIRRIGTDRALDRLAVVDSPAAPGVRDREVYGRPVDPAENPVWTEPPAPAPAAPKRKRG